MRAIDENRYSEVSIKEINNLAKTSPQELVEKSENYYNNQLDSAVSKIKQSSGAYKIVLICGPSASGKTTTAHKFKNRLIKGGIGSSVVSMDNFFKGIVNYPLRPNGKPDMESVETMDIEHMNRCFNDILKDGYCDFPVFDFEKQEKSDEPQRIELKEGDVLIVEGIHALNPSVTRGIPKEAVFRMYISVRTRFMNGEDIVLKPHNIRLIRRMIRDYLFRNYSAVHTVEYWNHVLSSEKINIDPYRDDVEFKMDTTLDYEVCCWNKLLRDRLDDFMVQDIVDAKAMKAIVDGLLEFEELDIDLIPVKSLLREFIGKGN